MKLGRLTIVFLLFAVIQPMVASAQFAYITNNGSITITGYTGPGGAVIIPDTTNNFPVTSIGYSAFLNKSSVTAITIPNSVTNIGNVAFENCIGLTNVALPTNLISLGDSAFFNCTQLTNITIPNSITFIGESVLSYCTSLTNIVLPSSLTSISTNAFAFSSLNNLVIPNSVTNIADKALWCWNMRSMYFLGNVPSIGVAPFSGNEIIYYLPGTKGWNSSLGNAQTLQLYNCTTNNGAITLTKYNGPGAGPVILCPNTISGLPVTSIGTNAFNSNPITSITIPTNVINLAFNAFYDCSSLTNVIISNNVTTIGDRAFQNCQNLVGFLMPNNIGSIGNDTFQFCASLKSISIPNSVTNFGYDAFAECTGLTNVTVGSNLIGLGAFSSCTNLVNLIMSNTVISIGPAAFQGCFSLTNVFIPYSVTNIGSLAFDYCLHLPAINVDPSNPYYSSVDGVLFDKTQSLLIAYPAGKVGNYTVPNGVTNILSNAFEACSGLPGVYFPGNAPSVGSFVFRADNATVYYLPGTTGWNSAYGGASSVVLWNPIAQNDANFGVSTNQFGFNIAGNSNLVVVVEGCPDLANPVWTAVSTNILSGGSSYFSDAQWTNYSSRFYRFRSP